jgi:type II secretory pathway component PulF
MNALDMVHKHILEGADIATPIRRSKIFPPVVGYMVAVGEQAGNLEEVLDQIAFTLRRGGRGRDAEDDGGSSSR